MEDFVDTPQVDVLDQIPVTNIPFDPNGQYRKLPEQVLLAAMIYGEATKESKEAFEKDGLAVGFTPLNRINSGWKHLGAGGTVSDAILMPKQYYSVGSDEFNKFLGHKAFGTGNDDWYAKRAMQIAYAILNGKVEDPTGGATHNFKPTDAGWKKFQERAGIDTAKPGENYYDYRAESGGHTYVREVMRPNEKPMKDKIKVAIQKPSVDNGKKKSVKKATK